MHITPQKEKPTMTKMTTPDSLPYVRGSETSKAAADSMRTSAGSIKHRVYHFILKAGNQGATDDEIEIGLNLTHQTASARRRNLELAGALVKTDNKRPTRSNRLAYVYTAIPGANLAAPGRPRKPRGERCEVKVTAYLTRPQHADLCMMAADRNIEPAKLLRLAWIAYGDQNMTGAQ